MCNRDAIHAIFQSAIKGDLPRYKSLYECTCEALGRPLPFRAQFIDTVVQDILGRQPSTISPRIVYVSAGPGGLLTDFIILNKLIDRGCHTLLFIGIEEQLTSNLAIIQACLDFETWWVNLARIKKIAVTTRFFTSWHAYQRACSADPSLRGNIMVCVDPDDPTTVPNFASEKFRASFAKRFKGCMITPAQFYYLYFQNIAGHPYRHMIRGAYSLHEKQPLLVLGHEYGEQAFTYADRHVFWRNNQVYPFSPDPTLVQINGAPVRDRHLAQLVNDQTV